MGPRRVAAGEGRRAPKKRRRPPPARAPRPSRPGPERASSRTSARHTRVFTHEVWSAEASSSPAPRLPGLHDRNQVDPACSHTLVSKIKPCMFKHKYHKAKLRMAHYISYNILDSFSTWITVVILELIHDQRRTRAAFIRYNQPFRPWRVIITELTVFVRRFLLISALSAFDGRVLAYHGVNG